MRLLPTALGAKGALFFATVLVLFLATPYSNLFFLLTAFLAVLGVLGVFGAWSNLRGIDVDAVQVEPAPVGGGHAVQLRLGIPNGRRCYGLSVWFEIDGRPHHVADITVATDGALVATEFAALDRGVHPIPAVRLRSRHPFGVCCGERRLRRPDLEAIVHPRPAEFGTEADGSDPRLDAGRQVVAAPRESVATLREWRAGDGLREIHWRASARRGKPIVKEHERDTDRGLEVVLDRRCGAGALERALSVAVRLLLDAGRDRQPLRLCSQDFDRTHGADGPPLLPTLRWLAAATTLPANVAPPPPTSPRSIRLPSPDPAAADRHAAAPAEVFRG